MSHGQSRIEGGGGGGAPDSRPPPDLSQLAVTRGKSVGLISMCIPTYDNIRFITNMF